MNARGTALVLLVTLSLAGCSLLPGPAAVEPPTAAPTGAAPVQDGPPPASGIVTLTPEEVLPEDVYTRSEPAGSFPMGLDLPRGFPAGIPAFTNRWVKAGFFSTINDDGSLSYSAMFVGGYDDVDALLAEFARQGWEDKGSDILPNRRAYVVENATYRVVITASETAKQEGELLDPTYSYTIVVL